MHAGLAGAPASESAAGDVRNAGGCGPGTVALPGAAIDPRRDDEPRPAGMWPAGAPAVCDGPPAASDGPRHEARRAPGRCARPAGMWPAARRGGVPDSHGVSTTHVPHGFLPRPRPCPAPSGHLPPSSHARVALVPCCGDARSGPTGIPKPPRTCVRDTGRESGRERGPLAGAGPDRRHRARIWQGPPAACRRGPLAGAGRLPAPGRIGDTGRESGRERGPLADEGSSSPTPDLTSSSRRSRGRRRSCPRGRMPAPAGRPPCPRGSP